MECSESLLGETIGEKIALKYTVLEPCEMATLAEEIDKAIGDASTRKDEGAEASYQRNSGFAASPTNGGVLPNQQPDVEIPSPSPTKH